VKKPNLFFEDQEIHATILSAFIETQDLQGPITASKVDGLTSAVQPSALCMDRHCFFFTDLTFSSHSTLQSDALHRPAKYPIDNVLQPSIPRGTRSDQLDVPQSTRLYLAAQCVMSAFLANTLVVLVHSLMPYIGFITHLPTCSGNIS
jgi:hypothetical protein